MLPISPIRRVISPNPPLDSDTPKMSLQTDGNPNPNSALNSARNSASKRRKLVDVTHLVDAAAPASGEDDAAKSPPKRFFDAFCDFTSISGFRFLHSRHPLWFRILSALILFSSIGMFFYHSSIYVRRFNDKRNSIQMYTTKVTNQTVPYIIVCPLRQFKSLLFYEGPPDFIHILSRYYVVPAQIPEVDGVSVLNATQRALAKAIKLAEMANGQQETSADSATTLNGLLNDGIEQFSQDPIFQKLFPQCVLLMRLRNGHKLVQDRPLVYRNYSNFREWQLQMNDSCLLEIIKIDPSLQNDSNMLKLVKCRLDFVVILLRNILNKIVNFAEFDAHRAKPSVEEYVIYCSWLDGGPCLVEWIPSETGIDCVKIGGKTHMHASYITLRNNIDIVLDTFAMDNQLSTWEERELRVLLSAENQSSVCSSVDGFA